MIKEDETSGPSQLENLRKDEEGKEMKLIKKNVIEEESNSIKGTRPSPLEILDRVKINNPHETPRSTIKGLLKVTSPAELSFSKARLKRLQDRLKQAFMEFHHKLRLLKSYRSQNTFYSILFPSWFPFLFCLLFFVFVLLALDLFFF